MKFDPINKEVFTNEGQFIKKMSCPEKVEWETMEKGKNDLKRMCKICNKSVIDTEFLSDDEMLFLVEKDANTCLRIISSINVNN